MSARRWSLRSTIAAVTGLVVSLAVLASGALVTLTTLLHRTTSNAATSVESVRLAQEAEIDLLLHGRATEPLIRRDLEESMRRRLFDARRFVTREQEQRALAEAESAVAAYVAGARDPSIGPAELTDRQEAAYVALEGLVTTNVSHAREAHAAAAWWDRVANHVGLGVGAVLLFAAAALLVWLKRRAFAPLFSLARAMERFGTGDRDARAEEAGPAELLEMSRRFNDMAAALATHRQKQIAFLGGVVHDLRNPLSALKLSVAAVAPDKPLPPEPRLRQLIEKIGRQIARLERMTGDFLDITRIEAGELELKVEVHDARDLVRAVVDLFGGASPDARIRVALPAEPAVLECDHLRVEQVLTNLLSNAIKYSPPGAEIEVALEPSSGEVVLRVTDHGVGIPEDERQRVFEPFRRVGSSTGGIPGAGLGLHVVRRIVDAHRGRVEVESAPGAGSTFRVHLPRRHDPGAGPGASRGEPPPLDR